MIFDGLDIHNLALLAQHLATRLIPGISVCLWGDLGAGKTTFARYLLKALDPAIKEVPSPTFTLIQQYATPQIDVWHCDFYRLKQPEEIFELGIEDAFYSDICLIEWPEKMGPYLPKNRIDICFKILSNSTRTLSLTTHGTVDDTLLDFYL